MRVRLDGCFRSGPLTALPASTPSVRPQRGPPSPFVRLWQASRGQGGRGITGARQHTVTLHVLGIVLCILFGACRSHISIHFVARARTPRKVACGHSKRIEVHSSGCPLIQGAKYETTPFPSHHHSLFPTKERQANSTHCEYLMTYRSAYMSSYGCKSSVDAASLALWLDLVMHLRVSHIA